MKINKFPVMLLANYRTGSSALNTLLGVENNLTVFYEPHLRPAAMQDLVDMVNKGESSFIVKFMPDQLDKHEIYKTLYNSNCYKIRLTRSDKVAQILSYYVADMTKVWNHEDPDIRGTDYFISVKDELIDVAIDRILKVDKLLKDSSIIFDQELVYESLNLEGSHVSKLIAPKNYLRLYSYIEKKLQNKML